MTEKGARVWVTRAWPGAEETAARLADLGLIPVVVPLLDVRPLPGGAIDLGDAGALAFTSARGVEAFAARSDDRRLPVFAVGDATAQAARAAGFGTVASASGDVVALAELIDARRDSFAGPLLHLGAAQPAGDLVGDLAARGVAARSLAVYETVERDPAPILPDLPRLAAALVHSPRAARALAAFLGSHPAPQLRLLALSAAVAEPLGSVKSAGIAVAPFPNESSLLNLL